VVFSRPSGTSAAEASYPALKCWATIDCPSGTYQTSMGAGANRAHEIGDELLKATTRVHQDPESEVRHITTQFGDFVEGRHGNSRRMDRRHERSFAAREDGGGRRGVRHPSGTTGHTRRNYRIAASRRVSAFAGGRGFSARSNMRWRRSNCDAHFGKLPTTGEGSYGLGVLPASNAGSVDRCRYLSAICTQEPTVVAVLVANAPPNQSLQTDRGPCSGFEIFRSARAAAAGLVRSSHRRCWAG